MGVLQYVWQQMDFKGIGGIGISEKAAELVVERIKADQGLFQEIIARTDIPKRTDLGDIPDTTHLKTKPSYMESKAAIVTGVAHTFRNNTLKLTILSQKMLGG